MERVVQWLELQKGGLMHPVRRPSYLGFLVIAIVGLLAVFGLSKTAAVKDIFVSVKTNSNTTSTPSPTVAPFPTVSAATPSNVQGAQITSPTPEASAEQSNPQNKTTVTVNGKNIPADGNGNVEYHEKTDGSNVDVSIKNSSSSHSTSTLKTENKINVDVSND